jgi:hypothetical protein
MLVASVAALMLLLTIGCRRARLQAQFFFRWQTSGAIRCLTRPV